MFVFRHHKQSRSLQAQNFVPHFASWMKEFDAIISDRNWSLIASVKLFCKEFSCSPYSFLFQPQFKDLQSGIFSHVTLLFTKKWDEASLRGRVTESGWTDGRTRCILAERRHPSQAVCWLMISCSVENGLLSWVSSDSPVSRDFSIFLQLNGTKGQTGWSDDKSSEEFCSLLSDCLCNLWLDVTKGKKKSCCHWPYW